MEEHIADDQSHYEISLTAGQAFVAFVLLLLSLAASFAFGLMLGRGQADERLVVRKDTPIVSEASALPKKSAGEIVELGVDPDDDFADPEGEKPAEPATASDAVIQEAAPPAAAELAPTVATEAVAAVVESKPAAATPAQAEPRSESARPAAMSPAPHFAQLLSTGDQKIAEALAVRLINRGFTSAYVERGSTDKGPIYRVRVRFPNEAEARAAEAKLHEFSRDVWITSK